MKKILSRITGFSTPILGVSWVPSEFERTIIRNLIVFLEDRRTLYNPYIMEIQEHCFASIFEIRQYLTDVLHEIDEESPAANSIRLMRAACRRFLDEPIIKVSRVTPYPISSTSEYVDSEKVAYYKRVYESKPEKPEERETRNVAGFFIKLGELRATFGIHIEKLCKDYDISVESELSTILPPGEVKG